MTFRNVYAKSAFHSVDKLTEVDLTLPLGQFPNNNNTGCPYLMNRGINVQCHNFVGRLSIE